MGDGLQNVLITGASTGLGLAIARRLIPAKDLRLILTAREQSLGRFSKLKLFETETLHIRPLRVNTESERCDVIKEIDDKWGGVDILINNAGVAYRGVLEHLHKDEIERQMDINFRAPFHLMQLVLPSMRKKQKGRIISVSSVGGILAMPTMTPYSASKWALEGVSEALWYEMRPWNIHVSVVQPGFINSNSFQNTRMTAAGKEAMADPDNPYHKHYFYMDQLIRYFMSIAIATPESVAEKVEKVMRSAKPPLRIPATIDAHVFSLMRRYLPRPLFHRILYFALPHIRDWGKP